MTSPGATFTPERETENLEGFLKAELDFGFTLATMATDRNLHSEHFGRRKRSAAAAVATVHQLMDLLKDDCARTEILGRCFQLERLIATL